VGAGAAVKLGAPLVIHSKGDHTMSSVTSLLKNEYTKRILYATGVRKPSLKARKTAHYHMPVLEEAGGWLSLDKYKGPEIPKNEWEDLTYTTYGSDPNTFFAPITSATGALELKGFWEHGKPDLDGVWTENAEKCPTLVKWVESIGARYGRVQLLRMQKNTMRECRWGLHLDNNNQLNPETNGWVVRIWMELTDDPSSALVVRQEQFDRDSEVRIPLPKYQQAVVDSEWLWHGGQHSGDHMRYAVIVSCESGPAVEQWIASQRTGSAQPQAAAQGS
jgi:hypothetical protein